MTSVSIHSNMENRRKNSLEHYHFKNKHRCVELTASQKISYERHSFIRKVRSCSRVTILKLRDIEFLV